MGAHVPHDVRGPGRFRPRVHALTHRPHSWLVAVGTATDPYQPIEGHYKLTRRSLEALAAVRNPVGLVTKGPMVVRDAEVLADIGRRGGCTVYMSVPTVDEDAWRALEPGTAHPLQRLRAVRILRDAGVNAGVLMAPVVPGFTTDPAKLEATIRAVADHGAAFMGANVMYLKGGTKDHFMEFLAKEFPHMVDGYNRLYAGAYAKPDYVTQVRGMIGVLQDRYDVDRRQRQMPSMANGEEIDKPLLEQTALAWPLTVIRGRKRLRPARGGGAKCREAAPPSAH